MTKEGKIPSLVYYSGYDRELAKASVGKGWWGLIDEIFDNYDRTENSKNQFKIIQVKEKYGALTVYLDSHQPYFSLFLQAMERKSMTICEDCGASGAEMYAVRGWKRTLCSSCAQRLGAEKCS